MSTVEKRRMCPNCRAFIGPKDQVCPYCGIPQTAATVQRSDDKELLAGFIPTSRFVTSLILLINGVLFVATLLQTSERGGGIMNIDLGTLRLFGAQWPEAIRAGHQWWRLVTAGFLHGGILHIAMNSWAMLDVGGMVEETFGAARMITIYFISTVVGFYFSSAFGGHVSVGASAGLLGLIGAMIAYGILDRTSTGSAIKTHFIGWAAAIFIIGMVANLRTDNWAHFGGLVGGFASAYIAGTPTPKPTQERIWQGLAMLALTLTAISFYFMVQFVVLVNR